MKLHIKYTYLCLILVFILGTACRSESAKCRKDHKKVDKMKKSGQLKNW